ncbi:hypothetical protein TrRE_jg1203, partial [Triparma retinervis]
MSSTKSGKRLKTLVAEIEDLREDLTTLTNQQAGQQWGSEGTGIKEGIGKKISRNEETVESKVEGGWIKTIMKSLVTIINNDSQTYPASVRRSSVEIIWSISANGCMSSHVLGRSAVTSAMVRALEAGGEGVREQTMGFFVTLSNKEEERRGLSERRGLLKFIADVLNGVIAPPDGAAGSELQHDCIWTAWNLSAAASSSIKDKLVGFNSLLRGVVRRGREALEVLNGGRGV